ncbi:MAG: galactokinase family protein [Sphaerochaetaceae bacterium]|jgi:galactokinase|nr:galactokinase family protein [Sphaerochaetaceae bacterium]MDD3365746.1 galactokinase family protein [Sphaerochaetaceae bacterium]MDD4219468.1 galactokinase family protein [Sphaerochaetaceae bacterium]MDY0371039.1 galactokinase family protein [Sphaerochaetaceae bacterium]
MKQIAELHQLEHEEKPKVVVTVPGVYTFLGEFADYCKGYTLCGAAPLALEVAISPRTDQSVRLFMAPMKDRKRFNLQNIKFRREDRWANFIKGVVSVLNGRGFTTGAFNVTLAGDLLSKDGAMVNSAIALGVTLAIRGQYHHDLTLEDCAAIAYSALSTFANEDCRLVMFLAMLQVRHDSLLLYDVHHLTFERIPYEVSANSHVALIVESRISPHALREELAIRRRESKLAFDHLRAIFPSGLIRDISEQDIKETVGTLSEEEKRICLYVLSESKLAKEGARLLAQKDMVLYGKILSRVQAGLRDVFEVTCPEIDWLTKRAIELNGCLGATMITTGSSGTILVLLSRESIALYITRMEEYEHIFGFRPTWKPYVPVGSLKIHSYNNGHTSNK